MSGKQKQKGPFLQADDWFTIAKSDTVLFVDDSTNNPQGYTIASVFVGTTGDISLLSPSGTTKVFKNIPSGTFMPVVAVRVNNTGTTATDLLGLVSGVGLGI